MWVVQEVVLARALLLHVNENILREDGKIFRPGHDFRHVLIRPTIGTWADLLCGHVSLGTFTLLHLALVRCASSEPRDRVFAITSLLPPNLRSIIPINYAAHLSSVLIDAIVACIVERGNLSILSFCNLVSDYPSAAGPTFDEGRLTPCLTRIKEIAGIETFDWMPLRHSLCAAWRPRIIMRRGRQSSSDTMGYQHGLGDV